MASVAAGGGGGGGSSPGSAQRKAPASPLAVTDGSAEAEAAQSPEQLLRDAEQAFGEIFSVQPPRDIFAGFWSGVKCVVCGVFLGVVGVITQPIQGAREEGVGGCFRGVASGVFTGIFLSVTGICTGMFQAVRGAIATPRAICMASKGYRWDAPAGRWTEPLVYSLPAEASSVLQAGGGEEDDDDEGGGPSSSSRPPRRAVDTYHYDQLGLSPSATQREIRQAYFQQSKKWHPDKSTLPRAKEKFQAISEAYQVLSDPSRRRQYDQQGRQGEGDFVDAHVFFSVLLGADALEPFIGRLKLAETFGDLFATATAASADVEGGEEAAQRELENKLRESLRAGRRQVRRQVRLAVSLAARLDARGAAGGAASSFRADADREARELLEKDFSVQRFLMEIGWVYRNRAESYLARLDSPLGGLGFWSVRLRLRRRGREASQQAHTAKMAFRSFMKLRQIVTEADEKAKSGAETEEELPSSVSSALPTFMEIFWSLSAHDITGTLDKVVERVLTDASVSPADLRQRAEGLVELGTAFVAAAEQAAARAAAPSAAAGAVAAAGASAEDERSRKRFEEAWIASCNPGARPAG